MKQAIIISGYVVSLVFVLLTIIFFVQSENNDLYAYRAGMSIFSLLVLIPLFFVLIAFVNKYDTPNKKDLLKRNTK
ncbi:MAG: hypothetical protein LBB59_01055 [Campylobacteraceae bacterium]|jgi:hypothetical protein|nr:hypothetical protein [Campylobacteraceae bacterium]